MAKLRQSFFKPCIFGNLRLSFSNSTSTIDRVDVPTLKPRIKFDELAFHCDEGFIFKHQETPEGFLRVWMTVSRVGELKYRNDNGSDRIEILTKEELFKPASLDTAWGKPITQGHPVEKVVTDVTAREYQRGMTQQAMLLNDDFLTIVGVVTDKELKEEIKSGKRTKVSAGYRTRLVTDEVGNLYQRDREYNHFSVCVNPRAGEEAKVHYANDSKDLEMVWRTDAIAEEQEERALQKGVSMAGHKRSRNDIALETEEDLEDNLEDDEDEYDEDDEDEYDEDDEEITILNVNGQDYAVDPDFAEAVLQMQERHDEMASDYNDLYTDRSRLDEELAAVRARLDELENGEDIRADELNDAIAEEIEARVDCWLTVSRIDSTIKPDLKMSSIEIKREFLGKVYPEIKLDEKDENFLEGLWLGAKEKILNNRADTRDAIASSAKDAAIKNTDGLLARLSNFSGFSREDENSPESQGNSKLEKARADRIAQIESNGRIQQKLT